MASTARAILITGTDPAFGANSLTIDKQTDLGWLNLSATAGFSYDQVLADMQPGGMFSNYTFASSQQVDGLYSDAGIGAPGYYSLSTPSIQSLISLVAAPGATGFIAVSGTPADVADEQEAPAIELTIINGEQVYFVTDGTDVGSTSYGDSASFSGVSDWLVTTVPEPGIGSIVTAGFTALVFMRRLKMPAKVSIGDEAAN